MSCDALTLEASTLLLEVGCDHIELCLGAVIQVSGGGTGAVVSLVSDTAINGSSGTAYNNTGSIGAVLATLPPAVSGKRYLFVVSAPQLFTVRPQGLDSILLDDFTMTNADGLSYDEVGGVLELQCHDAGTWIVLNIRREWRRFGT